MPTMSPESPHDATGIARRQFSTVRKGYDPQEVRAFLHEVSELVGRLQRSEAHERFTVWGPACPRTSEA